MLGIFNSNVTATPAVRADGSNGAEGLKASSDTGTAIEGVSYSGFGIIGGSKDGIAVVANSIGEEGIGIRATSKGGDAINAQSGGGIGVLGTSDDNVGVQGECQNGNNFGVVGRGANAGVAAFNPKNNNAAYLASACCAAWFTGGVTIIGKLHKSGGGFRIDHPSDPAKKFLSHSFVESPDMKNMYDGVVIVNRKGEAIITLPKWFQSINKEFRYQLTAIGASAPELHIAEEIKGNRFKIAGAKAGMKISWQVTAIRCDAWANANRIIVEENKNVKEHGYYLQPELNGEKEDKSIAGLLHQQLVKNDKRRVV
jgi:hypothetical protein